MLEVVEVFEIELELVEPLVWLVVGVEAEDEVVVETTDVMELVFAASAKYPAATTITTIMTTIPIIATLAIPRFQRLFLEFKINDARRPYSL